MKAKWEIPFAINNRLELAHTPNQRTLTRLILLTLLKHTKPVAILGSKKEHDLIHLTEGVVRALAIAG